VRYSSANLSEEGGAIANVHNLSQGGLMFTAYEQVGMGELLMITINMPFVEKPIQTYAKVIRSSRVSEEGQTYHVGLAFLELSESDRDLIKSVVEKAASDGDGKRLIEGQAWWKFWKKKRVRIIKK